MGYLLAFIGSTLASVAIYAFLKPNSPLNPSATLGTVKITDPNTGRETYVDPDTGESYEVMTQNLTDERRQTELAVLLSAKPDRGGS